MVKIQVYRRRASAPEQRIGKNIRITLALLPIRKKPPPETRPQLLPPVEQA
jgi:hypothetical protein